MSGVIFNVVENVQTFAKKQELRLAEAIVTDDLVTARKLLQQGINPNVGLVGQGGEPLIFLTFAKIWFTLPVEKIGDRPKSLYRIIVKEQCLRLLLEYGANPNLRDSLGRTVLEIAILWCMPSIVKLLLLHGADPNLRAKFSLTPLMRTAILGIQDARPMENKLRIISYLLDGGAEINAQASDGKTALMCAVSNARIEIVELLVSSGASLSITDQQGNQACDLISQRISQQQQVYLRRILSQPQLNTAKYKYQQFVPEGDRLLADILNHTDK